MFKLILLDRWLLGLCLLLVCHFFMHGMRACMSAWVGGCTWLHACVCAGYGAFTHVFVGVFVCVSSTIVPAIYLMSLHVADVERKW